MEHLILDKDEYSKDELKNIVFSLIDKLNLVTDKVINFVKKQSLLNEEINWDYKVLDMWNNQKREECLLKMKESILDLDEKYLIEVAERLSSYIQYIELELEEEDETIKEKVWILRNVVISIMPKINYYIEVNLNS